MQEDLSALCCGFGPHLTKPVRGYLNRFAALCREHYPRFVIFSGGATQQRTAPGRTEARVMHDYVVSRCPGLTGTTWLMDDDSFTSLENVRNAKRMLEERTEPGRLLTFTDAGRTLKVRFMARRLMPRWQVIQETYDLRSDPLGQIVSLALEVPMAVIPPLHVPWTFYRRGWRAKRI